MSKFFKRDVLFSKAEDGFSPFSFLITFIISVIMLVWSCVCCFIFQVQNIGNAWIMNSNFGHFLSNVGLLNEMTINIFSVVGIVILLGFFITCSVISLKNFVEYSYSVRSNC